MLAKVDPAATENPFKNLTPLEIAKLEDLLEPYDAMGEYFPPFLARGTRENFQRLVVKAAGIDDGEF